MEMCCSEDVNPAWLVVPYAISSAKGTIVHMHISHALMWSL